MSFVRTQSRRIAAQGRLICRIHRAIDQPLREKWVIRDEDGNEVEPKQIISHLLQAQFEVTTKLVDSAKDGITEIDHGVLTLNIRLESDVEGSL